MGVPSFYRWLVEKYPKVVMEAKQGDGDPVDTSLPNPNGFEFDNLYLDMNGIIHPCFHPEDQLVPPSTYDQVFEAIFEYIDRIFCIVRPRKLLYMAIDGVAPRAKMNQQRARRYRTAKDTEIAEEEEEKLRKQYQLEGIEVLPKQECEVADSNVITPGTIFMEKLSRALEYYIRLRLNSDPGWKMIKVILSDANVPGEGEHKIMSFIRLQRSLPGYNCNTLHCLYGLDADLIMLALATHEIHFTILREDVLFRQQILPTLETSFSKAEFELKTRESFGKAVRGRRKGFPNKPYQFLKIWTLRKYLELDLKIPDPPFELDLERQIDDFIFICFFTGNDFLPCLPSLEVHEEAINLLISVYKSEFKKIGGYLIDTSRIKDKKAAYIKVKHVERFILAVGSFEERIFEKRQRIRQQKLQNFLRGRLQDLGADSENWHRARPESTHVSVLVEKYSILSNPSEQYNHVSGSVACIHSDSSDVAENTKALMQNLRNILKEKSDLFKQGSLNDRVALGFPGWRQRYYEQKFPAVRPEDAGSLPKNLVMKYAEGLCWVLQYYFAGVCSWNWFYPFHYGPFASDIKGLNCSSIRFTLASPFKPFDQLMAVLPPRSANALPKTYQHLMNDVNSGLKEFYPPDFEVDVDGKRFLWQGIVKLPFIVEGLLITETRKLEGGLYEDEQRRNSTKLDKIFVSWCHDLGGDICFLYHSHEHLTERGRKEMNIPIDCNKSGGMNGFLSLCDDKPEAYYSSPVKGMADIMADHVVCAFYKNPMFHDHIPRLLENVAMPMEEITESDIFERRLWHEYDGRSAAPQLGRGKYQQGNDGRSHSAALHGWRGRGRGPLRGHCYYDGVPNSPDGDGEDQNANVWRRAAGGASASSGRGRDGGSPFWSSGGRSPAGVGRSWSGEGGGGRGLGPGQGGGTWRATGGRGGGGLGRGQGGGGSGPG